MKKTTMYLLVALILIATYAFFVSAAGVSEGSSGSGSVGSGSVGASTNMVTTTNTATTSNSANTSSNSTANSGNSASAGTNAAYQSNGQANGQTSASANARASASVNFGQSACDNMSTTLDRIRCRLVNHVEENVTPEGCRNTTQANTCTSFYVNTEHCYAVTASAKAACFHAEANRISPQIAQQRRYYQVALLYELERRVELKFNQSTVSAENATMFINEIVSIKQSILNNEDKAQVSAQIAQLRLDWNTVMRP